MAYVDYAYYQSLYGDSAISEADFNRLYEDAEVLIDNAVTAFGVNKLEVASPTKEKAVKRVKRCVCELIQKSAEVETKEKSIAENSGYIKREDGTVVNKAVSSISSGNESISYATGSGSYQETWADRAVADRGELEETQRTIITKYLSEIPDANGVNLLFKGRYPYIITKNS